MKPSTPGTPIRLGDGRQLHYERDLPRSVQVWRAGGGLIVCISRDAYGNHASISCAGGPPSKSDVDLVRAAVFEEGATIVQGTVSTAGVVHLIEPVRKDE